MQTALPSPCISICQIDPHSGQCVGCYRSRQEIARWGRMSAEEQAALLNDLRDRRAEQTGVKRRPTRRRPV